MQPTRRELLAGAGTGLAAGLAGCSGQLTADGAAFGAVEASLSASVQSDTDYSHHRTEEFTVTREFNRFGLSRNVEVTNVISEYDRAIELGVLGQRLQAAVFATLSTPQVEILWKSFNPVAEMSTVEIAHVIQERYENVSNVRERESFESTVSGESTTVTRFTARADLVATGAGVDVYLYVSEAVELGGEFVVCLAVHPQAMGQARGTVETLLAGVEHE
jgi:hypothetical protein